MGKSLGAGEIHYGDSAIENRLAKSLSHHGLVLKEKTPSFATVAGERLVAYRTFTLRSGYAISYARSVRNLLLENVFGKPTADRIIFDYLHRVYPDPAGQYSDVRLDLARLARIQGESFWVGEELMFEFPAGDDAPPGRVVFEAWADSIFRVGLEHGGGRHLREAFLVYKRSETSDPEQVPSLRDGEHLLPERYPYAMLQRDELITMMVDYLLLRGSGSTPLTYSA
ncbi:MAG: hypothetical protein HYZ81_01990 [Nitrospinae bacterium]|nr:hypothetical protein [Nitrospinota bacterium]